MQKDPNKGFAAISPNVFVQLALQMAKLKKLTTRDAFIRFAPEMNGNWMEYSNDVSISTK